MKKILALASGCLLLAVSAQANSITLSQTGIVGDTWFYTATFVNSTLNPGDFININDFGLAVNPANPANWVFSQAPTGPNSIPLGPADDTALLNATWTYQGPTLVMSAGPNIANPIVFALTSVGGSASGVQKFYTTIDQVTSGVGIVGTDSRVIGYTTVPLVRQVPDGGLTIALLGSALMGIAGLRRRFGK